MKVFILYAMTLVLTVIGAIRSARRAEEEKKG